MPTSGNIPPGEVASMTPSWISLLISDTSHSQLLSATIPPEEVPSFDATAASPYFDIHEPNTLFSTALLLPARTILEQ
jgi:hypothetical protein